MKVLLVTGNYLPGKNGGIENYTHWLANLLMERNYQVEVASLNLKERKDYFYEGIKVTYLEAGFTSFKTLLKEGGYEICHFQEYSFGGIELSWFTEAKKYSKVFFTFHLPYLTCYKGDFRYKGISDCNDFSKLERCVTCCISTKLDYKPNAKRNLKDRTIDLMMPFIKRSKKGITLRNNIVSRKKELEGLIKNCDRIFVYGKWFKKILEENGYHDSSLIEICHISDINLGRNKEIDRRIEGKVIFAGRIEKQKGLHLLCKALNLIKLSNVQLDVYGNIVDANYYKSCENEFAFNYKGSVPKKDLLKTFVHYDFLILPSVFTEMSSLVLREAFYEKLPVIVSNAKGNKDVVKEGINGFLFEYSNAKDLAATIDKAYDLKKKGWQPEFTYPDDPEKDIEEIVSYYR